MSLEGIPENEHGDVAELVFSHAKKIQEELKDSDGILVIISVIKDGKMTTQGHLTPHISWINKRFLFIEAAKSVSAGLKFDGNPSES